MYNLFLQSIRESDLHNTDRSILVTLLKYHTVMHCHSFRSRASQAAMAEAAGVNLSTIYRRLKHLGIVTAVRKRGRGRPLTHIVNLKSILTEHNCTTVQMSTPPQNDHPQAPLETPESLCTITVQNAMLKNESPLNQIVVSDPEEEMVAVGERAMLKSEGVYIQGPIGAVKVPDVQALPSRARRAHAPGLIDFDLSLSSLELDTDLNQSISSLTPNAITREANGPCFAFAPSSPCPCVGQLLLRLENALGIGTIQPKVNMHEFIHQSGHDVETGMNLVYFYLRHGHEKDWIARGGFAQSSVTKYFDRAQTETRLGESQLPTDRRNKRGNHVKDQSDHTPQETPYGKALTKTFAEKEKEKPQYRAEIADNAKRDLLAIVNSCKHELVERADGLYNCHHCELHETPESAKRKGIIWPTNSTKETENE